MNVKNGTLAIRGHRNHMQAINEVFMKRFHRGNGKEEYSKIWNHV